MSQTWNWTATWEIISLHQILVLSISRESKQVYAQATGQSKIAAYAETNTKFFFKVINAKMEFIKDAQGKVSKMIFTQGATIEVRKL